MAIDKNYIVIGKAHDKIMIIVSLDKFKLFNLPYASTLHSIQGLNKSEKITIFNTDTPHITRRFVWTAITRVRNLDQITFKIAGKKEIDSLKCSLYKRYLNDKINGYITPLILSLKYFNVNYLFFFFYNYIFIIFRITNFIITLLYLIINIKYFIHFYVYINV